MRNALPGALPMAIVIISLLVIGLAARGAGTAAQDGLSLAVDADPAGNTATWVPGQGPSIEDCLSVQSGAEFDVDIVVENVTNLLGWQAFFVYDESILEVSDVNVKLFQAANPNSSILDASEQVPDTDGVFLVAAADPTALDSGSGVLARLTLHALGEGVSPAELPELAPGVGPTLSALTPSDEIEHLGDVDGDGVFDGPTFNARIAVETPCPTPIPEPTLSPSPTAPPQETPGQTPEAGQTPTPGQTSEAGQTPTADQTPEAGQTPTADQTPEAEQTPGPDQTPAAGQTAGPGTPSADASPAAGPTQGQGRIGGSRSDDSSGLPIWIVGPIAAAVLVLAFGVFGAWRAARHHPT